VVSEDKRGRFPVYRIRKRAEAVSLCHVQKHTDNAQLKYINNVIQRRVFLFAVCPSYKITKKIQIKNKKFNKKN
jgi:hypothetical protein